LYDVTKFLEDHPGGEDVLLHVSGIISINSTSPQPVPLHVLVITLQIHYNTIDHTNRNNFSFTWWLSLLPNICIKGLCRNCNLDENFNFSSPHIFIISFVSRKSSFSNISYQFSPNKVQTIKLHSWSFGLKS
jgi:hypothetical protein